MNKYFVTNRVATERMINGIEPWNDITGNYVGDYIEADTAEEAIDLAIDYLCEYAREGGFIPIAERKTNEINFYRNSKFQCRYCGFEAREIEIKDKRIIW